MTVPRAPAGRARVTGRVTDRQGKPIARAAVVVAEGTAAVPEMAVLTNADGVYAWSLPPGTFRIAVTKEGYVPQSGQVTIASGGEVTLDFSLDPQ